VNYETIEYEFNVFYNKSENIYDINRKAYWASLILYTLLLLDITDENGKEDKEFKIKLC